MLTYVTLILNIGRMNQFAWNSFCEKMDEALSPIQKAKKVMVVGVGSTMALGLVLIIISFVSFGVLANKSMSSMSNDPWSGGSSSPSPALGMIPFVIGGVLMVAGTCGSSVYASRKSGEARNAMKKVCEETSAMHPGISFHIRDQMVFMGYSRRNYNNDNGYGYNSGYDANYSHTNYIEVYVTDGTTPATAGVQGYLAPTSLPSAPPVVAAVAEGVVKSPQERMRELEGMRGMLTEDEYQAKRAEILSDV